MIDTVRLPKGTKNLDIYYKMLKDGWILVKLEGTTYVLERERPIVKPKAVASVITTVKDNKDRLREALAVTNARLKNENLTLAGMRKLKGRVARIQKKLANL